MSLPASKVKVLQSSLTVRPLSRKSNPGSEIVFGKFDFECFAQRDDAAPLALIAAFDEDDIAGPKVELVVVIGQWLNQKFCKLRGIHENLYSVQKLRIPLLLKSLKSTFIVCTGNDIRRLIICTGIIVINRLTNRMIVHANHSLHIILSWL